MVALIRLVFARVASPERSRYIARSPFSAVNGSKASPKVRKHWKKGRKQSLAAMPKKQHALPGKDELRVPVPEKPAKQVVDVPPPTMLDVEGDFARADGDTPLFTEMPMETEFAEPVKNKSRIDYRLKLRSGEKFLIDPILPRGTMNLLGGPSGIGKTTWLFQTLYDWQHGMPVLGKYRSQPCSFVYVSFDRGVLETDRTLRRLGFGSWDIPIYSIEDLGNEPEIGIIFDRFPDVDLYVVEGLQAALPDGRGNQNRAEMRWAIEMRKKMLNKGKTLLATTHSPKSQIDTAHSRSNFLGSVSLHACFSTMISFDIPQSARDVIKSAHVRTDDREVLIQGRDFPDISLSYSRDDSGRFRMMDSDFDAEIKIDTWLSQVPNGTRITSKEFEGRIRKTGMSRTAFYRWIEQLLGQNVLIRVAKGLYAKV